MGVTGLTNTLCFLGLLPLDNCEMSAAAYYTAMLHISRHVIGALILNSLLFLGEICYRLQQLFQSYKDDMTYSSRPVTSTHAN